MLWGPAAARSQAVRVIPTHEVSFSPFYQQNSWQQRRRGESYMRKYDTTESGPVSSSVPRRTRIFFLFLKNIFWYYFEWHKYQTKHLWCVTVESSRSELLKTECSFVFIKTTLSALHFTFITPLKWHERVWLSSWNRMITLWALSQYPPATLPSSCISCRWFRKYKDWYCGDTVKVNKAHSFPLSISHTDWVSAMCQVLC